MGRSDSLRSIFIGSILALLLGCSAGYLYYQGYTVEEVTVLKKFFEPGTIYFVDTNKGIFEVNYAFFQTPIFQALIKGERDPADIWGYDAVDDEWRRLVEGQRYRFYCFGWRLDFMRLYPVVYHAEPGVSLKQITPDTPRILGFIPPSERSLNVLIPFKDRKIKQLSLVRPRQFEPSSSSASGS